MPSQDFEALNADLKQTSVNIGLNIRKPMRGKRWYHPSNTPETYAVNAVTGVKYSFRVGSFDSLRSFLVVDTRTTCDNKGLVIKNNNKDADVGHSNWLYYDNPEQYMQHRKVSLDDAVVQAWHKRVNILFPEAGGDFDHEAYERLQQEKAMKIREEFKERQEHDAERIRNNTLYVKEFVPSFYIREVDEQWRRVVNTRRRRRRPYNPTAMTATV